MSGEAELDLFSSGMENIAVAVVKIVAATLDDCSRAVVVTLVGSIIPISNKDPYSPVFTLYPGQSQLLSSKYLIFVKI